MRDVASDPSILGTFGIRLRPGSNEQMSETDLQGSYRPEKLCIWSKIRQGIWFWRQKSSSSSNIDRNWRKTQKTRKLKKIQISNFNFAKAGAPPVPSRTAVRPGPSLGKIKICQVFWTSERRNWAPTVVQTWEVVYLEQNRSRNQILTSKVA